MRRIDILKRASRNLSKNKKRTILTSLAIAVGATTITLALAAGNGGRAYINDLVSKFSDKNSITVTRKIEVSKEKSDPLELKTLAQIEQEKSAEKDKNDTSKYTLSDADFAKISKINGVSKANAIVTVFTKSARIDNGEKYDISATVQQNDRQIQLSAGKLGGLRIPRGKVVAPKSLARALKLGETDLIGKKVTFEIPIRTEKNPENTEIFEQTFEIVAVDAGKTDTDFNYANGFILSNEDGIEINRKVQGKENLSYYGISVTANGVRSLSEIAAEIQNLDMARYDVSTFEQEYSTVSAGVSVMSAGLAGFGALAILAAVFGIVNTQYISVLERTSQIGLMKSLGAKKGDISKMFRYEAAWIGFLGAMLGVIIACGFAAVGNALLRNSGTSIFTAGVTVDLLQINWVEVAILVAGLVFVAVVSGFFPARKAAKMNPIEALRAE